MHLPVHSGWESGYGPRPRFEIRLNSDLSFTPSSRSSPSPFSPPLLSSFSREFLRLNPRLVVVHSRNSMWRSVEQVGGSRRRIHSESEAKSNLARLQYPHPLDPLLQIRTSYRCIPSSPSSQRPLVFDAPSFLRRHGSSAATWITRRQFAERGLRLGDGCGRE